jgi:hypothetical protein
MQFTDFERQPADHSRFMYDTIYFQHPDGDDDFVEGDWDDEDDEDFDDRAEDLDDLHEIQVDDDLNEPDPDPDDDDHLPDDDLQ